MRCPRCDRLLSDGPALTCPNGCHDMTTWPPEELARLRQHAHRYLGASDLRIRTIAATLLAFLPKESSDARPS